MQLKNFLHADTFSKKIFSTHDMIDDFFEFGMLKPIPYFVAASLMESPSLVSVP